MIPYFTQPTLSLGPVTIAAFGLIIASSVAVAMTLGARRFAAFGVDAALGERFFWWVVGGGFVGAHLFSVVLYFPHKVAANPLVLFKVWEDVSSFGGIIGGTIAIVAFLRLHAAQMDRSTRWAFIDTACSVFPVALMIGRLGCALAHDHPGRVTSFPLGISLETPAAQTFIRGAYAAGGRAAELPPLDALGALGFHDLGVYELLYLALVVVPVILLRERRDHASGTHRAGIAMVTFIVLYMPVRFALDFLRVSDVRYGGLTPAQWAALAALGLLPLLARRARSVPPRPFPSGPAADLRGST